ADEQLASPTERAGHRQRSLQNGPFVLFKEMSLDLGALAGFRHKRLTQLIYKTIRQTIAAFAALFIFVQKRIEGFREILGSLAHYFRSILKCVYGKVARSSVQYGERERPERKSIGLLIDAQVAHAPRTVPLAVPYTHLQTAIV